MFGYNIAYDIMLRVLTQEPLIRAALVDELQAMLVEDKVLRFPGGTPSRTWTYNHDNMELWIQFCKDAGVEKLTYVWNIHDNESSILGLSHLAAHLDIVCVEVGNEEYYHNRATGFFADLINNNAFFASRYYTPRGKAYGNKFKVARDMARNILPDVPVAATFGNENAVAYTAWNKGVKQAVPDLTDIVLHEYWTADDSKFQANFRRGVSKLQNYKIWFTETNLEWDQGRLYHIAYTDEHRIKLQAYLDMLRDLQLQGILDTDLIQIHSLYKNNGFGRYRWENGVLVDKYENWF